MKPAVVYLTASQTVHIGPAIIHAVYLAGDGAAADAQVYDGQNTLGRQLFHIEAASGGDAGREPPHGVPVDFGIFVAVNAATSKLTISYTPQPKP